MLLTKEVEMRWNNKTRQYFIDLGYEYTKNGDVFLAKIEDIKKESHIKIKYKCDFCGAIKETSYGNYNRTHDDLGDCCFKCSDIKKKRTSFEKYGVENPQKEAWYQDKRKKTCLKKYGVDSPMKSEKVKNKLKQVMIEKYGVDNPLKNDEVKNKLKKTCLEKYGVEHYSKTDAFKEKVKKTSLEKYGVESPNSSEDIKNKKKLSCLEKYGVDNVSKISEIKDKKKNTLYEHYGVYNPLQSEDIVRKMKETLFKNYGVYNPLQSKDIMKRMKNTLFKNGNCATSKAQLSLYNLLKDNYDICKLNYPLGKYSLDCMLQINNQKIDVEFDGQYWHQNSKDKDDIRDKYCIDNNYKILRIKGNYNIPTLEELQQNIDKLVTTNCNYLEIYTDWKKINI